MNKKVMLFVALTVLTVLAVGTTFAQGIPGSGWWSGEQVQNVGTTTATISITAYDSASVSTYVTSTQVTSGSAFTFVPSSFASMPSGFVGSAIVSSDQPIKAIVNVTNQQSGSLGVAGGKAAAQYQGTESPATALYFPLAKNNRFAKTTAFYIQNAGSAAATATAVFKMDNGGVYTFTTPSIGPGQMVLVSPSDAGVPSSPSDSSRVNIGSMSITSAQPLAGTVMEYTVGETVATVLKGTRGFTSSDFDDKAYAPVVKRNRFNRFTGIQIQNVGGSAIDVTISYVGTSSSCLNQTAQDSATGIAPGTSRTFVQSTGNTNFPDNCTGSATITATGNFVAIVNEDTVVGSTAGITYSTISDNKKTAKLSAPLFKDQRFGFSSGLQIQNVGSAQATNVVATFSCRVNATTTFTAISLPQTIPAGGATLFYKPSTTPTRFTGGNPFSQAGVNCAVTVTGDQPLVAIVNETPDTAGALDDNNYEAFNLTP
jgi:hypothetical protein